MTFIVSAANGDLAQKTLDIVITPKLSLGENWRDTGYRVSGDGTVKACTNDSPGVRPIASYGVKHAASSSFCFS